LGAARPLYPHFQRRGKVTALASLVGFCESSAWRHLAYTIYFEKPVSQPTIA
jgi:hypothetical protein